MSTSENANGLKFWARCWQFWHLTKIFDIFTAITETFHHFNETICKRTHVKTFMIPIVLMDGDIIFPDAGWNRSLGGDKKVDGELYPGSQHRQLGCFSFSWPPENLEPIHRNTGVSYSLFSGARNIVINRTKQCKLLRFLHGLLNKFVFLSIGIMEN